MTIEELKSLRDTTFAPGLKGVFSIYPLKEVLCEKGSVFSLILSFLFSLCLFFFPEMQVKYIEQVVDLVFLIIPAILGLSLSGFAIVISQVTDDKLKKTGKISEGKSYSIYQKTNSVFAITVLAQFSILFISLLIKLFMPLTLLIPVPITLALYGNSFFLFLLITLFIYALVITIDLVKNIFTSGQIVNLLSITDEIKQKE